MPKNLLVEARPSEAQRAFMEDHGFTMEHETDNGAFVTWCGHGVKLDLLHNKVPTPRALCGLIAQESRKTMLKGIRRKFWQFLGTPSLDAPVPFELVEKELASDGQSAIRNPQSAIAHA